MNKLELIEELLKHLSNSQGGDLKALVDESNKPPEMLEKDPSMDSMDDSGVKPKGLSVEKVEVIPEGEMMMGEGADDEMTDDELKELLKKHLSE